MTEQETKTKEIPKKFWHGYKQPVAKTVGDLKRILEELPDELRVSGTFGGPIQAVVFNIGCDDEQLRFEDPME